MKTVLRALCALLSLLVASPAFAQTEMVPPTISVVVSICYMTIITQTPKGAPENFQKPNRTQLSEFVRKETDEFLNEFQEQFGVEGFKVSLLQECSMEDDAGGGVIALLMFANGVPDAQGKVPYIGITPYLKASGGRGLVLATAPGIPPNAIGDKKAKKERAAKLVRDMAERIRAGQKSNASKMD